MRRSSRYHYGLVGLPAIVSMTRNVWLGREEPHLLQLVFFSLLVFAGFRCLAVELFRGELLQKDVSRGSRE